MEELEKLIRKESLRANLAIRWISRCNACESPPTKYLGRRKLALYMWKSAQVRLLRHWDSVQTKELLPVGTVLAVTEAWNRALRVHSSVNA